MITFVHQPEYLPWLGFFDKLAKCDVFIVYDDAQYVHGSFQNRNKIRTIQGWRWLTVPIKHNHPQMIKDVKIAGDQWKQEHLRIIKLNYEKAPYFRDYFPILEKAFAVNYEFLIELDLNLIEIIADSLGFKIKFARSSSFSYQGTEKNEKLISLCKQLGAETYLSGSGGRTYVNENEFSNDGVKVIWHSYNHPTYKQNYKGFEPYMSIIDLLFNMGPESKHTILKGSVLNEVAAMTKPDFSDSLIIEQ